MKVYQKVITSFFIFWAVCAGGAAAFSAMAAENAVAQDAGMEGMVIPQPCAAPGMSSADLDIVQAEAGSAPQAGTTTPTPSPYPSVSAGNPIVLMDYADYSAWLAVGAKDKYIVLEVLKVKKDKTGKVTSTSVGNQYVYDLVELTKSSVQKGIRVDLSFLKATSEQNIRIYGDSNPANTTQLQINPQPKKPSIKYAGGVFTAKIDKKDTVLTPVQLDKYEYKTLYGSKWNSLKNYNGTTSAIAGTTLLVRERATATTPAGVEAKIKIPAAAKAPKVTIDYVKGIVSIPKGVEFKVFAQGKEGNWASVDSAAKLTPTEILDKFVPYIGGVLTAEDKKAALEVKGFSIIARTAAVTKNNVVTKAASQPIFVDIPAATKVTKVQNEDKILGSVPATIYLTYRNVEKGIEMTAVGGNFDYSADDGKSWKTVKPDAKKPTVAAPKGDAKGILIRESGMKASKTKEGVEIPARLPSANSVSTAWLPPLEIDMAGQGLGAGGALLVVAGSNAELNFGVSQGKDSVTDAVIKHTTTLPTTSNLSVAGGRVTFVAPAYNETGANTYVIEITASKTNFTAAVYKITITVVKQ